MKRILVTGAAGFIGFHLVKELAARPGVKIVGLDNLNDYYDPNLKKARLKELRPLKNFSFYKCDLNNQKKLKEIFRAGKFDCVLHMAAQAGVRYSITNPSVYIDSNLLGFANILELSKTYKIQHLVFASSSSVYGANTKIPFSTSDNVDHPLSLYAATKKSNELMAHAYSHLFRMPVTGLRFFTVYGPWGRPDMSYFLFTHAILKNKPIQVFNQGKMQRDFTYVDDIVAGVLRTMEKVPTADPNWSGKEPNPGTSNAPYRIYNIGNNQPVELMHFIETLERALGKKAKLNMLPMQPGDVVATFADVSDLEREVGFRPSISIEAGLQKFVDWYRAYY